MPPSMDAWWIIGSAGALIIAALALALFRLVGRAVSYLTSLVAVAVVEDIGDLLEQRWSQTMTEHLEPLREDMAWVKGELVFDGGNSLKDRVLDVQRQLEMLIVDRRQPTEEI